MTVNCQGLRKLKKCKGFASQSHFIGLALQCFTCLCSCVVVPRVALERLPQRQKRKFKMKHYYKFSINYEDEYAIHSVNQELKKGDVTVIPVYADEFAIGTVVEPISELKALTECGEVEDVITVVNTKPYTDKQKARIKRHQLHSLMKERLDEFKEIDTFRKIAEKDTKFRALYEAYQKTELSDEELLAFDDVSETLEEE